ncbi:MAG: hypothetical protein JSV49_08795, partial [Thermoplasmata archaeon]
MKGKGPRFSFIFSLFIVISLFFGFITSGVASFTEEEEPEEKKYKIEKYEKTFIIAINDYNSEDIAFKNGTEMEVIFSFEETDNNPIDFWFVNDDNYLLLSGGAQFLYFIDGSGQHLSYAKRIVTLQEHDDYKLVLSNNYVDDSVQLELTMELRTYVEDIDGDV